MAGLGVKTIIMLSEADCPQSLFVWHATRSVSPHQTLAIATAPDASGGCHTKSSKAHSDIHLTVKCVIV